MSGKFRTLDFDMFTIHNTYCLVNCIQRHRYHVFVFCTLITSGLLAFFVTIDFTLVFLLLIFHLEALGQAWTVHTRLEVHIWRRKLNVLFGKPQLNNFSVLKIVLCSKIAMNCSFILKTSCSLLRVKDSSAWIWKSITIMRMYESSHRNLWESMKVLTRTYENLWKFSPELMRMHESSHQNLWECIKVLTGIWALLKGEFPLLLDAASTSSLNSSDPFSDLLSASWSDPLSGPMSDSLSDPLSGPMSASELSISPLFPTSIKKCFFPVSIKKCFFPVARFTFTIRIILTSGEGWKIHTSNVRTRRSGQQSKKKLFIVERNKENPSLSDQGMKEGYTSDVFTPNFTFPVLFLIMS